ncbi:hypothetical protein C8Q74DRAFT_519762 [Fomes fomentarius]|nr:hypothetical protein C8Q74DRAFT_519762 [Fomes fomentarius]
MVLSALCSHRSRSVRMRGPMPFGSWFSVCAVSFRKRSGEELGRARVCQYMRQYTMNPLPACQHLGARFLALAASVGGAKYQSMTMILARFLCGCYMFDATRRASVSVTEILHDQRDAPFTKIAKLKTQTLFAQHGHFPTCDQNASQSFIFGTPCSLPAPPLLFLWSLTLYDRCDATYRFVPYVSHRTERLPSEPAPRDAC